MFLFNLKYNDETPYIRTTFWARYKSYAVLINGHRIYDAPQLPRQWVCQIYETLYRDFEM